MHLYFANKLLQYFYWEEIFYAVALALIKVSILFFYLRIFPRHGFRVCACILLGLHICYAIAYSLTVAFQCNPIDGAWLNWTNEYGARCVSINLLGWSGAAVNIFLDLCTIFLPVPELLALNMSVKKRMQIMLMFAVGLL
jgi:hypothetical protein